MAERTSNEMQNLSLRTNSRFSFPSDLLTRFIIPTTTNHRPPRGSDDPDEDLGSGSGEEVELNLGLSLGGRFGVDKSNSKLVRSSSIAAILPVVKDDDDVVLGSGHADRVSGYSGLIRTSSLPVETEEEWRKRKELQSLRRLAAKRRRSEKQRSLTKGEREEFVAGMNRVGSNKWPPSGGGGAVTGGTSKGSSGRGGETNSYLLESSSFSNQPVGPPDRESSSKRNTGKQIGSSCSMEDMPCVFTQGDGPNGRVVEGILYKYGKGEQVKIMCICHGSFLSPAEFVKHAGGTDFLNPLKHIVVKPSSSFS